jgi:hypothetical protein
VVLPPCFALGGFVAFFFLLGGFVALFCSGCVGGFVAFFFVWAALSLCFALGGFVVFVGSSGLYDPARSSCPYL